LSGIPKENLMHLFTRHCLLVSCLALVTPLASAQVTIDQQQPDSPLPIADIQQTGLAQSFQTAAAAIAGAGFMLRQTEESGPLTIALWDALPTEGGTKLAENTAKGAGTLWVDVFWTPVIAQASKTYYLTVTSEVPYLVLAGSLDNYAKGMAYANAYTAFPQFDYAFRTYAAPVPATPVPEPATMTMLLAGLGLVSMVRRRRSVAAE
jgi:hypothetical protein